MKRSNLKISSYRNRFYNLRIKRIHYERISTIISFKEKETKINMNLNEESLKLHEENRGKIEVISKTEVKDLHDLAVVYTPGVAEPCRKIHQDTSLVYKYTNKGNIW